MSCPYYTFRQNDFYCMKSSEYVNQDVYRRYCRDYSYDECPIYRGDTGTSYSTGGSGSSGCYLTSACVEAKGLPDDCRELTVLREFRDGWLKNQPGGLAEVAEYYATAPGIVMKINGKPDAKQVWLRLYETLVCPCVALIQQGKMEEAHDIYRRCAVNLDLKYRR
ncbi:MAG: hypothetical protein PUA87_09070 [Oscillospiraceae bacterium]|nr:hypothetical protein [Oscillospiraceae bacterium]